MTAPAAARHRPWPLDEQGRLLAATPARGLVVEVHLGGAGRFFDRWRVAACSRARFVARTAGRAEERPAAEWGAWLDARAAEGTLSAHLPGCALSWCKGCDTASLGRPGVPPGAPARRPGAATVRAGPGPASRSTTPAPRALPAPGVSMPAVDVGARDARVLRAAKDVLARYTFHPLPPAEPGERLVRLEVHGGARPYTVTVDPDWRTPARCTCPDHARASNGGFCKHVIGALLRDEALRCQLLELFL
jgi:hypothetical protein